MSVHDYPSFNRTTFTAEQLFVIKEVMSNALFNLAPDMRCDNPKEACKVMYSRYIHAMDKLEGMKI